MKHQFLIDLFINVLIISISELGIIYQDSFEGKRQNEAIQMLLNYFPKQIKMKQIDKNRPSIPIMKCEKYLDIFKIIGRLKHNFSRYPMSVVYRGQRNHYGWWLYPALARNFVHKDNFDYTGYRQSEKQLNELIIRIESHLSEFYKRNVGFEFDNNKYFNRSMNKDDFFHSLAWEPILQHYGINTRWLDVVDTVPIGLWFSIYDFEKNEIDDGIGKKKDENGYLFVLGVHYYSTDSYFDGFKASDVNIIANLRTISPPLALRPHVQHALVLTDKRLLNSYFDNKLLAEKISRFRVSMQGKSWERVMSEYDNRIDLNRFLFCVLTFKKKKVIEWLFGDRDNSPENLQFNTLFPPPTKDSLYRQLLDTQNKNQKIKNLINDYRSLLGEITEYDLVI